MTWHTFRHEAMATYFEIAIAIADRKYAEQAATAVFREVDRLESELSRFVESSDISRLNRLREGECTMVGDDAIECLVVAADISLATQRAFDAAYLSVHDGNGSAFTIDPTSHVVTSHARPLQIDLGAIGKGYALDVGAALLGEWGLTSACLVAGGSTVVALEPPPSSDGWRIGIGDGTSATSLALQHAALSASGTTVKGQHLIDPRTRQPARRDTRTWALATSGAQSDALSTAFFVMSDDEVIRFCSERPQIGAAFTSNDRKLRGCGALHGKV